MAKVKKKVARVSPHVAKRAKEITVFLMDVDGTITDGSVTLNGPEIFAEASHRKYR